MHEPSDRRSGRAPTIVDVATAAGFSVSTVSRVLRGGQDVNSMTRARIQEVMLELGFRPSPIARALVTGEWRLIALLVSDLTNPFYPQLARSVELSARALGYTVIICNTDDDIDITVSSIERLSRQGLDGIINASGRGQEDELLKVLLDPRRIVFANRRPSSDRFSSVVSDNESGAKELARHLISLGHRHIGFIGGPSYATNAMDRERGFQEVIAEHPGATAFVSRGPFGRQNGYRTVSSWLDQGFPISAVVGVNDTVAIGALEAVLEHGLRVPEDISVAGFDNVDLATSAIFHLTTVSLDIERMGKLAVELLISQLKAEGKFKPTSMVLTPRLVTRKTSGTPSNDPA